MHTAGFTDPAFARVGTGLLPVIREPSPEPSRQMMGVQFTLV